MLSSLDLMSSFPLILSEYLTNASSNCSSGALQTSTSMTGKNIPTTEVTLRQMR